jgi:arsenate reductase-like glutaredoxin family protein
MTCGKTQEFLARKGIAAKTLVDARKQRLGSDAALKLAQDVTEIIAAKGKKVVRFHLAKDKPSRDDLLAVLLGPSGNLRAPTLRKGKKLLIGFDLDSYEEVLG